MAAHTITIDDETFAAVKTEADRRNTSVEVVVAEYLKRYAANSSANSGSYSDSGSSDDPLWLPGVTRQQLYWDRMRGNREPNPQLEALEELVAYAEDHPCRIDLTGFSRDDLYERG